MNGILAQTTKKAGDAKLKTFAVGHTLEERELKKSGVFLISCYAIGGLVWQLTLICGKDGGIPKIGQSMHKREAGCNPGCVFRNNISS